ncbi:MAG: hypothetical protein J5I93_16185, partial [Pirellulaceae bacterium]|nr:hypothetical protein [Pirellulaceae bacterium]
MPRCYLLLLLSPLLALLIAAPLRAQPQPAQEDPFQTNVRPTEPLTPQEEQAALRVPPGFEVQLVAAEPEILKPMNLAFDERGRLWVSDSTEYPYAAPLDRPGRDSIKILEDTDGDGRADRITTFADGLNIPIGVLPYGDGAIVFSIPNIWYLRDTDGDGQADRREKLFGPMGFERDTHGMNNAFRRGFDGWIYACHGFNNETRVQGRDGHLVHMKSGNTYRMRADGSRIEQFTWGQVNPFGMTIDAWGNLFTADCHSKPIYQLLRGGYYPSFGAPHDGLGFVPPMMNHLHGSTAIAGVAYYSGRNFPAEYRGNLYSGNVMTSRVNRNLMEYHGSTILARELPDFVVSEDPWFRPVDMQVGPDGAMYVADFYNRIIGHYEVPLTHPGRDRHRGRIWRIVYRGDDPGSRPAEMPRALSELTDEQRIAELGDESLARRLAATNYLVDTAGDSALDQLLQSLQSGGAGVTGPLRVHGLWVLHRRGRLPAETLAAAAADGDRLVATHAMKILADMPRWSDAQRGLVLLGLEHPGAFVRRAAADALALHPDPRNLEPLLSLLGQVADDDPLLRQTVRIALRDNLRAAEAWAALPDEARQGEQAGQIAELCLAIPHDAAARFLLDYLRRQEAPREQVAEYVRHAARYIPAAEASALAELVRRRFAGDLDFQQQLLESLVAGVEQRGGQLDQPLSEWAMELAAALLATIDDQALAWSNIPLAGMAPADNPWVLQQRPCSDGQPADFLCSLPHGERLTGVLRSRPFTIPERLTFYTAGHLGFPNEPLVPKNFIRLRDARTHALLREARPPRHDTARQVEWNLSELAGRQGYLELVDGDDRPAYAWLAVGRFEPPVVGLPPLAPRDVTERLRGAGQLIGRFRLEQFDERLLGLLSSPALVEPAAIEAVAGALVQREPSGLL